MTDDAWGPVPICPDCLTTFIDFVGKDERGRHIYKCALCKEELTWADELDLGDCEMEGSE